MALRTPIHAEWPKVWGVLAVPSLQMIQNFLVRTLTEGWQRECISIWRSLDVWHKLQPLLYGTYRHARSLCCTCTCAFIPDLVISVYKSMCCTCTGLSAIAVVLPLDVTACLQEPVLYLYMCFCAAHGHISISLHEPVLHLYGSVYKSNCAAPGRICLQTPVLHLTSKHLNYIYII